MIQTLKLGLTGSELTLPTESRVNEQGAPTPYTNEARSANKTLHVDFITTKDSWVITWDVLSKSDYDNVYAEYLKQFTTPSFLNFIYSDEQGSETSTTVKCSISSKGSIIQTGDWFYNSVTLTLEQV